MMTEQDILDHMTNMGASVNNIMSAANSSEAMLTGLLANRDEVPDGMLDQLDKSLKDIRSGKLEMNEKLEEMQEIFNRNGNNSSK